MALGLTFNRLAEWSFVAGLEPRLAAAARLAVSRVAPGTTGELSVTCLSDDEMTALNLRHLDREEPTDVIAFELGDGGSLLADVYVAPATVRRHAAAYDVPPEEEMLRVVIHGVLHVLGLDHPPGSEREESPMFRLQEELLRELLPR
ncbi:MAG: rRNA maturation RNase YbeY [Gemmatimonadota bacterium]